MFKIYTLTTSTSQLRVSVVVPAYNEERNIRALLRSILGQVLRCGEFVEIVVVASGCTDRTIERVEEIAASDPRVRLIVQDVRLGKVSAINAYLRERDLSADVIVVSSADLRLQPGCMEMLVRAFVENSNVGMAGGHPMPANPRGTMMGDVVHFLWELHDRGATEKPKLGEIVAVRASLMRALDERSAVDEASIEQLVSALGHELVYVPSAVVTNHGPTRIREYFEQRRRVNAGHLHIRETTGYTVSTMDWRSNLRLALQYVTMTDPRRDAACAVAVGIEVLARATAYFDQWRNFDHSVWQVITTAHPSLDEPQGDPES